MITKVVGGKALPKEIADQIIERTDGIRLFIEELTKAVIESGLVAEAGDHYRVTGPVTPFDHLPCCAVAAVSSPKITEGAQIGVALMPSISLRLACLYFSGIF